MIRQFRNLTPANLFFLVVIGVVLRLGLLVHLPDTLEFEFAKPFLRFLIPVPTEPFFSPLVNISITFIIILIQATILNKIVNNHNLLGKPSFLPALMYVTTSAILVPFTVLSPTLLCNFLLIWMIEKFLSIYRRNEVGSVMYDMGLMVGVGTLIYFPFIAMFIVLYVSLLIYRPFNWREWIIGLLGFGTVYFFVAIFYYWNDSFDQFYQIWIPLATPFRSNIGIKFYDYIVLIPLIIILALSAFSLRMNFFKSYVHIRKSFQLLFFLFILAILSFYLKQQVRIYHFLLAVPAASIFMGYYFLHAKKAWVYESLYFLLVAFIIYFQIV
jgi:hypothetical protein